MSNHGKRKKAKASARRKELLTNAQHSDVHTLNKKKNGSLAVRPPRITLFIDTFSRMVIGFRIGDKMDYKSLGELTSGAAPGKGGGVSC